MITPESKMNVDHDICMQTANKKFEVHTLVVAA